ARLQGAPDPVVEDLQVRVAQDLEAFEDIAGEFGDLIGLPLLVHMASTIYRLEGIETISQLFDRFKRQWYEREMRSTRSLHPDHEDACRVMAARLALEMHFGEGGLQLPERRSEDLLKHPREIRWPDGGLFAGSPYRTDSYASNP